MAEEVLLGSKLGTRRDQVRIRRLQDSTEQVCSQELAF